MLIKIVLIAIVLCFVTLLLKKYAAEFVMPAELLFLILTATYIFNELSEKIQDIISAFSFSSTSEEIFTTLVKGAAVCIVCKFSSDICTENGNILFSGIIDLSGKAVLLIISYPFIKGIINTAVAFIE